MKKYMPRAFFAAGLLALAMAAQAQGFIDARKPKAADPVPPAAAAAPAAPAAAPAAAVVASPPAAPPAPKAIVHDLRTGEPIHSELKRWAEFYGWDFHWYPARSWRTLRDTTIPKPQVDEAVAEVIEILRGEGKNVQLRISEGNRVMEVFSTEVRND